MSFGRHVPPRSDGRKEILGLHANHPRHSHVHDCRVTAGIVSVFLAVIVCIAFGQALRHDFVSYDDQYYVLQNPRVTDGVTPGGIQWAFTHVDASNWHPLTTISHMLDCEFYGLEPWGHHLTNILLQATAAIFLFFALRKLTGNLWPSLLVAAIFAVHPQRVESVAWVSERKDVLSGVFFMLTLCAYARYARDNKRPFWYVTVVVLFALGLMCKPTLVTVPFVLLLLDYWPLGRGQTSSSFGNGIGSNKWIWLIVEKVPLFVLSAASCVATLVAQKHALDTSLKPLLTERVGNALISYVTYMGQMIWPARLAVLYPYPEGTLKVGQAILALLILLVISMGVFVWRRKYPFLLTGWLWYVGVLVPMIGIIQVGSQVRADRYTYLPQIGLYIMCAWGAKELFHRWNRGPVILAAAGSLIITALITRSYFQSFYWRDTETLWRHAIATTSGNYIAHNNLAQFLSQCGRFDEAIAESREAVKIKPDLAAAHNNLGAALIQSKQRGGTIDEAIAHYRRALQIKPDFAQAQGNLGTALFLKGQVNEAIAHYQKALEIDPNYAEARYSLGNAFLAEGKYNESITAYENAVRIRPDYFEAHYNLGRVLATIGNTAEALKEFNEALRINEDSPEAHYAVGSLLAHMGHREEAIAHLTEALQLKPDYERAKQQLRELSASVPQ